MGSQISCLWHAHLKKPMNLKHFVYLACHVYIVVNVADIPVPDAKVSIMSSQVVLEQH